MTAESEGWRESEKRHNQRIAIAARIAAGMAANPRVYESNGWKGDVARDAWDVAGRILLLAESGGC